LKFYTEDEYAIASKFDEVITPYIIIVWILIIATFLFSSKLIAMETLLIFQFIYGGIVMLRKIEPIMVPYKKLWIFNGYNIITKDDSRNLLTNFTALDMGSDFFENFNIGVILFFLPTVIGLILLAVHKLLIKRRKPNKLDVYAKDAMGNWQICALLLNIQQLTFAFIINAN
jgi:hypothetical protein